ncbi:heparinase II/III family protein [Flavimaricola marinus]|uniref:Heparinase II/III-like protein n=1 Tax=Flavimaricola marinus TaxID=1819565 RepID=A0A238LHX5_9RHOB|nr:heparinase II/III family protein [Flavimaricola marinus]SMY08995.1 Heparinase II/III-like protein [Flavimaricola marinus]
MASGQTWTARRTRLLNQIHARLAGRPAPATAFVSSPEPRTIGQYAKGRQMIAGNFLFAGHLIEAPNTQIWDIAPEDAPFVDALHGFGWLDDLAAVGDRKAAERAQDWVYGWISRYEKGRGPGWTPDLTGRRLIRWINHAVLLLRGRDKADGDRFYRSLSRQVVFLSRRWRTAAPGLPRFEAVTGLIYAGLSLEGMSGHVQPAIRALESDCREDVDAEGGIPSRNPEELLEVFTLLTWAIAALKEAGEPVPQSVTDAISRIAPTLRALRHSDGGLARFHGGGRGLDGRLDHALANSGVKAFHHGGLHMGYARVTAGRTSLIVDAAAPPKGPASADAHASTLAFEMTSGRRPVIVNCGSGASFGPEWRRAGRATPSHSTLSIEGYSSARLGPSGHDGDPREMLVDVPETVVCEIQEAGGAFKLQLSHNGWQRTHGLTHGRVIDSTADGRSILGEEILTTLSTADEARFDRMLDGFQLQGIPFSVRFHLHPDVQADLDMGGTAVSLALKSGEVWIFRQEGASDMLLEQSVYLESGRLRPRSTKQVVLTGVAMSYATRVRWSLAKAQDTPDVVRDYARSGPSLGFGPDGRAEEPET